jgi:hypothetical protein
MCGSWSPVTDSLSIARSTVYAPLQQHFGHLMRLNSREARQRMEILEGGVYEPIFGISDVKSFTYQDGEVKQFSDR